MIPGDGVGPELSEATMRVLDATTRDGFFAFELERRGAEEVVAQAKKPDDKAAQAVAQRSFQANSKVIQTISQTLQDLIQNV